MDETVPIPPPAETEDPQLSGPVGTLTWTAPLAWLEQILPRSPVLADLRRSLPRPRTWPGPSPPSRIGASPLLEGEERVEETSGPTLGPREGSVAPEEDLPGGLQPQEAPLGHDPVASLAAWPPAPDALTTSITSEAKAPVLQPNKVARSSPESVSALETSGCPLDAEGVSPPLEKEGDPDTPPSPPAGEGWPSPPPSLEAGGGFSPGGESLLSGQEVDPGTPRAAASGETLWSPPGFSEACGNTSLEHGAPALQHSEGVAAGPEPPVSPRIVGFSPSLLDTPSIGSSQREALASELGEPRGDPLAPALSAKEEEPVLGEEEEGDSLPDSLVLACTSPPTETGVNSVLEQDASVSRGCRGAGGPSTPAGPGEIWAPSPLDLSPVEKILSSGSLGLSGAARLASSLEGEEKPPLLVQDVCTSTPLSVGASSAVGTSLPGCPEPGRQVIQQLKCHALGCPCHGLWTSPLSLLEAGPSRSPEQRPCGEGAGVTSVSPEATESPPRVRVAGPNPPTPQCREKGVNVSPTPVVSSAAGTSPPPARQEAGVNTSVEEKATTQDGAAETDSLLWHCSREQLSRLSRSELEGRLESTLIIMEALSHQMRAWQDHRRPAAPLGPSGQREASTQTPTSDPKQEEQLHRDLYAGLGRQFRALQRSRASEQDLARQLPEALAEMKSWASHNAQLLDTADGAFRHVQRDRESLGQQQKCFGDLLARCRREIQSSRRREEGMKAETERALKAKEAVDLALASLRSHAGARIQALEEGAEARRRLHGLLKEANSYQAALSLEYQKCIEEGTERASALQGHWAKMRVDYESFRSVIGRCTVTIRRMSEELGAAQEERARHQEVCRKLEEHTVELVAALERVNELAEAKSGLEKDLAAALQNAATAEGDRQQLRGEKESLSQQLEVKQDTIRRLEEAVARLSWEKEQAEKERDVALKEVREASDCQEFIEQENRIVGRQLAETEEELRAALALLRERSMSFEDLKDAHRALQEEQQALRKDLASSAAEIQSNKAHLKAFTKSLQQIQTVRTEFLEMAESLRAALPGEAGDAAPRTSYCTPARPTPHRPGASFVDSVLKAASEKGSETPGIWSTTTAFAKVVPAVPPTPSEIREDLASCAQGLQEAAAQIRLLSSLRQEAAQKEARSLQAKITQLQQQLESLAGQLQAEREAGEAQVARLSKSLQARVQNEKELREAIRQQEEWVKRLRDDSREVTILQEEVSQLKYALQKSQTEVSVLREELCSATVSDVDWVEEKIWLRQEVGKLKEQLFQKDSQRAELQTRYLCQVRNLEGQLHRANQALRKLEKAEAEAKEVLSTFPAEVAGLAEVRRLAELLP